MQYIGKEKFTTTLDPKLEPAVRISSGDELIVETWDAYMGNWQAPDESKLRSPATGPIFIESASPGDALRIDISDIKVGDKCIHNVRPNYGFLPETFTKHYPTVMEIKKTMWSFVAV